MPDGGDPSHLLQWIASGQLSWGLMGVRAPALFAACAVLAMVGFSACKPKTTGDAEAKGDIAWLADDASPQAMAALGRLADSNPSAVAALEKRSSIDVNAYIAAWEAVTRDAAWGTTFLRTALADPTRADTAATALPRTRPAARPVRPRSRGRGLRLSAGHRGSVVAGMLASIGPTAHAHVERRLVDPKTRGAMCDGIALPEASGDAKSLVLAVPPAGRDHASCVDMVLTMAATENVVLDWLATNAEPGLITATAKSGLPCARLGVIWAKGARGASARDPLRARRAAAALSRRCASTLDPIIADLLEKAPRSRACIMQAVDPYSGELTDLKLTCRTLRGGMGKRRVGPDPRARARRALARLPVRALTQGPGARSAAEVRGLDLGVRRELLRVAAQRDLAGAQDVRALRRRRARCACSARRPGS